jgi:hypothetical protein
MTDFPGVWQLVSFESRDESGASVRPMGSAATGLLIYGVAGDMSVQLMRPDRGRFAGEDWGDGSDAEIRAAFTGYLAYFGRYAVDPERSTVSHFVEGSLFPNWIGTEQVRHYRLDGDHLTLTAPPIVRGGRRLGSVLVWERLRRSAGGAGHGL